MNVSDLFVKCLENEGVKYIFGLPGEENQDLLFSLSKSSIQFIPTRHEQGAAFMADVWGRMTGKAGVCLATLGPGATNLITGVADSNLDKSPLVAITGQAGLHQKHTESHQLLDVVNMFHTITKWNSAVSSPEAVPEIIRKAFRIAESEKPGATHIELSEDVAKIETTGEPVNVLKLRRPAPEYKAIQGAVDLLKKAKRPLVIAGNGAIRKLASKQLREFVSRHTIPVVHTFMGQGAISDKSPLSLLTIGLGFRDIVMDAVDEADLVITVGYDLAEYDPAKWNPSGKKTILHIDFTPAEFSVQYQPKGEVIADISGTLWQLNQILDKKDLSYDPGWFTPIRKEILDDLKSYDLKKGDAFTIPGALNILRSVMGDDDLLISDVGSHKVWIGRNFPVYSPNGCLISNGLASMGIALPGGIAACLAQPDRRVVTAMGDGGFMMNSQELETAKRLGVGFTVIIFNDNDYGLISWKQKIERGQSVGTKITNPDFVAYAESFGIKGFRPKEPEELRSLLEESLESRELRVIEIPVDAGVNLALVEKLRQRK